MAGTDSHSQPWTPRKHVAEAFYEYTSKGLTASMVESKADNLPALSLYMFVTSLMALGGRIRRLGQIELGIAEFMSWQRPAMTVCVLLAYSVLCYRPQWLVLLPLFLFIVNVLVPNYAEKFKIRYPENEGGDIVPLSTPQPDADNEKQARSLLAAVRQGQHSLTHIVETLDKFDQFRDGPAKFADPQPSCLMLVGCTVALFTSAIGLTYVSVPAFFTMTGWCVVCSKHPVVKRAKKKMEKVKLKSSFDMEQTLASVQSLASRLVLLDDAPLERMVEIFELQPQGLTPRQWNSLQAVFSETMYTSETRYRLEKQLAPSVGDLADVLPPEGWQFESGEPWHPDPDADSWVKERQVAHVTVDGGWAVDSDADSLSDTWRRRRWTRRCFHVYN